MNLFNMLYTIVDIGLCFMQWARNLLWTEDIRLTLIRGTVRIQDSHFFFNFLFTSLLEI